MNKKLVYLLVGLMLATQTTGVFAKSTSSSPLKVAIKKYKARNYTGCLQDCQRIVISHPSALAYYYMAMSFAQAGKKDEAINAYTKAISMSSNVKLTEYANTGKRCLETPDQCKLEDTSTTDLDKIIYSQYKNGLSSPVVKDLQQRQLNNLKQQINNGQDMNDYQLDKLNYKPDDNTAKVAQKPTNDEVAAAIKVLKDAGINPYEQTQLNAMENSDLTQLNMLMGNGQTNENNSMMNMLPSMLMQNKDGTNNYSPQVIQAMIMNSMTSSYNWNYDDSNKNN